MANLDKLLKKCQRARTVDRLIDKIIGGIIIAVIATLLLYLAYRLVRPHDAPRSKNRQTLMDDMNRPKRFAP